MDCWKELTESNKKSHASSLLKLNFEIPIREHGSSDSYLGIEKLTSEVLFVYPENDLETIVFVKETYAPKEKNPYSSFVIYYLVKTVKGLKIYKVR